MSKLLANLLLLKESKAKETDSVGFKTNWWAWVSKLPIGGPLETAGETKVQDLPTIWDGWASKLTQKRKSEATETPETNQGPADVDGETQARKIIVDNSTISGATLLNTLHSQGLEIVKKEADASSSNGPSLMAKKESSKQIPIHARFVEGSARNDAVGWTRFRCVLLQEGMGNFRDAYYYSRDALESAIALFEGKKIYADHPTEVESAVRPERSVKDVLGHFENLSIVTDKDSGQSQLEADVVIMPEESYRWARGLLKHSVEYSKKYPDKEFVGLSINASGSAEPQPIDSVIESAPSGAKIKLQQAKAELGLTEVRVVSKIEDAISCDLVTEAGAGGKILTMIEQESNMSKKPNKIKESEEKKIEAKVDEAAPPIADDKKDTKPADGAGDASGHDDEQKDIELIKKMIAQYLGSGDEEPGAEEMEMAMEAYGHNKEMGMAEDESLKQAAYAVKLAKHMSKKKEGFPPKKDAKPVDGDKSEAPPKKDEVEESKECGDEMKKESEVKESEENKEKKESNKVVELTGKLSLLESQIKAFQIRDHLDKVCRESGLGMSATKKFRDLEDIKSAKSESEIDKLFKVFKEAATHGGEADEKYNFVIQAEKISHSSSGKKSLSFEDCVK